MVVPDTHPVDHAWGITQKCAEGLMSGANGWRLAPHLEATLNIDVEKQRANALLRDGCKPEALLAFMKVAQANSPLQLIQLPPMFAEMLEYQGFNADAALALSVASTCGLSVLKDASSKSDQQLFNINIPARDMTWIGLGDNKSSWRDDCILTTNIPESLKTSMVGKPLRQLLSHPVLDQRDIMITAISECWEDSNRIEIETDLHVQWGEGA